MKLQGQVLHLCLTTDVSIIGPQQETSFRRPDLGFWRNISDRRTARRDPSRHEAYSCRYGVKRYESG